MSQSVSVIGAGRMGSLASTIIEQTEGLSLHSVLNSKSDLSEMDGASVVIDFSTLEVSQEVAARAIENSQSLIIGTSGWTEQAMQKIRSQTLKSAVLFVPNFSVGSMLLQMFSASASKFFDSVEIVEAHHPHKVDSPSGTAVRTAELMAQARGEDFNSPNSGQRARGQLVAGIPIHSMRMAGVSALQEVNLANDFESLKLVHNTNSHQAYAKGMQLALLAVSAMQGVNVGLASLISE